MRLDFYLQKKIISMADSSNIKSHRGYLCFGLQIRTHFKELILSWVLALWEVFWECNQRVAESDDSAFNIVIVPSTLLEISNDETGIRVEGSMGYKDGSVGIFISEPVEEHDNGIVPSNHIVEELPVSIQIPVYPL
jgi:hypothetical protein